MPQDTVFVVEGDQGWATSKKKGDYVVAFTDVASAEAFRTEALEANGVILRIACRTFFAEMLRQQAAGFMIDPMAGELEGDAELIGRISRLLGEE